MSELPFSLLPAPETQAFCEGVISEMPLRDLPAFPTSMMKRLQLQQEMRTLSQISFHDFLIEFLSQNSLLKPSII